MQSNGCSEDKKGCGPKAVVQGEVGGCPIREALWQTRGGKARNALLQTIEACKRKNPCHCLRDVRKSKEIQDSGEEEAGTTSGETEES